MWEVPLLPWRKRTFVSLKTQGHKGESAQTGLAKHLKLIIVNHILFAVTLWTSTSSYKLKTQWYTHFFWSSFPYGSFRAHINLFNKLVEFAFVFCYRGLSRDFCNEWRKDISPPLHHWMHLATLTPSTLSNLASTPPCPPGYASWSCQWPSWLKSKAQLLDVLIPHLSVFTTAFFLNWYPPLALGCHPCSALPYSDEESQAFSLSLLPLAPTFTLMASVNTAHRHLWNLYLQLPCLLWAPKPYSSWPAWLDVFNTPHCQKVITLQSFEAQPVLYIWINGPPYAK